MFHSPDVVIDEQSGYISAAYSIDNWLFECFATNPFARDSSFLFTGAVVGRSIGSIVW